LDYIERPCGSQTSEEEEKKKKNRRFIDKTALGRSESSVWVGCTLNYKVKCFQVLPNTPAGGC
jgi:hypothetical protein